MITIIATVLAVLFAASCAFIGWRFKLVKRLYWRSIMALSLLLALATGAGMLPIVQADATQIVTNTDIIFLVDTTYSMNALDGRGGQSRLASVRQDIKTYAEQMAGSRFGIITFDNAPTIYLPLTATTADIAVAADTLQTKQYYEATLDPNFTKAFDQTKTYLDQAAKVDVTRQRVLVIMTDGELTGANDTAAKVQGAARALAPSVQKSVVIGYGSDAGARMPTILTDYTNFDQKQTSTPVSQVSNGKYGPVVSVRDKAFLQALAGSLNAGYVDAANTGDVLNLLVSSRQQAAASKTAQPESQALLQNILHVPAALLIIAFLCGYELIGSARLRRALAAKGRT